MTVISGKIFWTLAFAIIITAFLFLIQSFYRRYKFSAEISRKIAHISFGLIAVVFIRLIDDIYIIGLISIVTFIVLLLTKLREGLDSIHKTERKSIGSVVYPLPFFVCYLVAVLEDNQLYLYLPLLSLILADPAAAIAGKGLKWKPYWIWKEIRTISGSLAFFITALVITVFLVHEFGRSGYPVRPGMILLIAFTATIVEALSPLGTDNLTVPMAQLMLIRLLLI